MLLRSWLSVILLAAIGVLTACGDVASFDATLDLDQTSGALTLPEGWRPWRVLPDNAGSSAQFSDSPAVCLSTRDGVLILGRDKVTNRYRSTVNTWRVWSGVDSPNGVAPSPTWVDQGTRTFSSKPACTSLDETVEWFDPVPPINYQVAVAGRSANSSRYYVRTLLVDHTPYIDPYSGWGLPRAPAQPSVVNDWGTISNEAYASAPALTVSYGKLMVLGRPNNGSQLILNQYPLATNNVGNPYSGGQWSSYYVPSLPTNWTAGGDPSLANAKPLIGVVALMTRATRPGYADRLYFIYWNSSSFSPSWQQVPMGNVSVKSDPAIETDINGDTLATVYVRGQTSAADAGRIFHASTNFVGWESFSIVRPQENDVFVSGSSPAAVGDGNFEGWHFLVAKKADEKFYYSTPNISRF